ncbi:MAG TPA: ATP-binding cassette domain-containing protein [Longimicrobiaceae bacterium]
MSIDLSIDLGLGDFRLRVAFGVAEGITALFGPSGAGKTLTLRSIAGLTTPQSGRIVVSGRTLFDSAASINVPPRERGIGFLFQQYALFPHLTVEQNVGFGLHRLSRSLRARRVAEVLALVGLDDLADRRPSQLSGGQQQRVALARALAPEPDLLLLDEPFAAVDMRTRRRLRAELRRIQEATATPMILVTHDLTEVRQLSDSLVVIEYGQVLAAGPTEAVLAEAEAIFSELTEESIE